MSEKQLHVFSDEFDRVVAYDVDDAWTVWCEFTGGSREDYDDNAFAKREDEKALKIWCNAAGRPCEHGEKGGAPVERTCREWADREGRGFLCSSEF